MGPRGDSHTPGPRMVDILVGELAAARVAGGGFPRTVEDRILFVREVWDLAEAMVAEKRRRAAP